MNRPFIPTMMISRRYTYHNYNAIINVIEIDYTNLDEEEDNNDRL